MFYYVLGFWEYENERLSFLLSALGIILIIANYIISHLFVIILRNAQYTISDQLTSSPTNILFYAPLVAMILSTTITSDYVFSASIILDNVFLAIACIFLSIFDQSKYGGYFTVSDQRDNMLRLFRLYLRPSSFQSVNFILRQSNLCEADIQKISEDYFRYRTIY